MIDGAVLLTRRIFRHDAAVDQAGLETRAAWLFNVLAAGVYNFADFGGDLT